MPVKINGATSGSVTLAAPATGSDVTLTLPGTTATVATLADPTFTGNVVLPSTTTIGGGTNLGAWISWTPTLSSITLGNGTLTAKYIQIGKTVHFRIRFLFGSTSSISNSPMFSLPVNSVASSPNGISLGTALIVDSGTTYPTPACAVVADNNVIVRAIRVNSTYVEAIDMSSTIPWTWAVNDIIDVAGTYEAA